MVKRAPDPTRRNERARQAIHAAARELVAEVGYGPVTIEKIAARAGVGKQTIYRWWPSKGAVLLDALVEETVSAEGAAPTPATGDLVADLRAVLSGSVAYLTEPANDKLLRAITAEMQYDPDLAADVIDRLLQPQIDEIVERIRLASPARPDGGAADPFVMGELLVGAIFHRWLLRTAPFDDGYVDHLVQHVVGPHGAATSAPPPGLNPRAVKKRRAAKR